MDKILESTADECTYESGRGEYYTMQMLSNKRMRRAIVCHVILIWIELQPLIAKY
jgi:hypothetical protein